jgi:hypothetical protein
VAKGSHATFGGWEPRVCDGCGETITLSGKKARGAMFSFDPRSGAGRSRHADCNWREHGEHPEPTPTTGSG